MSKKAKRDAIVHLTGLGPSPLAEVLGPRFKVQQPYRSRKIYITCRTCYIAWQLPLSHERSIEDASWLTRHECDSVLLADLEKRRAA